MLIVLHQPNSDPDHVGHWLARSDGPFENQVFAYGHAAFGVQFHPEIINALVRRWTAQDPQELTASGAQPAHEQ